MTISLADIRAKLLASQNKARTDNPRSRANDDLASYPFWDTPVGATSTIRLLPDGDETNSFFWRDKHVIKLPFSGVVGGEYPSNSDVLVTVTSPRTFGMKCPVAELTKHLWADKTPEGKSYALKYWKKTSSIFQGFVVSSAFDEKEVPANPIRRFVFNSGLLKKVESALTNPDIDDLVTDYTTGRDFRINKTKKGEWSSYDDSSFAMKTRALSSQERAAIDEFGLFNLAEFLGKPTTDEEMQMIREMTQDSLDGQPFDAVKYAPFRAFPAYGSSSTPAVPVAQAPVAPAPAAEAPVMSHSQRQNAEEILKRIAAKTGKTA